MIINVLLCDIDKARESGGVRCPIGCSIQREHKRGVPCMAADWIWIDGLGDCELPKIARKFVRDFDAGRSVGKLKFQLPLEKPSRIRGRVA